MTNDLPESWIGTKREIEARDGMNEIGRDLKDRGRDVRFLGEEQDVRQEPREGLFGPDGLDRVALSVVEEVDPDERGGAILARQRQLAPERRAEAHGAPL